MSGVVVVESGSRSAGSMAVREAVVRNTRLVTLHHWDLPVEIDLDLDAIPGSKADMRAVATDEPIRTALLGTDPELIVLGRQREHHHLTHLVRWCLRQAPCPVLVVPDSDDAPAPPARIVAAVSDSSAAATALRWATDESLLHHADLHVFRAWQAHPSAWHDLLHPSHMRAAQRQQAERDLTIWIRRCECAVEATWTALEGSPLDRLLESTGPDDLLVVGRAPHGPRDLLLHGRLAEDLALLAPCPVAMIPDGVLTAQSAR